MDPLVHRLRELDPNTFQELCFHLMKEKYPSGQICYVQGASGDEGLDLFRGELTCGPTVWQCKSFQVTMIGDSQKDQIRKSLQKAIASCSPKVWVLCLNMDLDTKAHRWFQRLQATYASKGVRIDLVQGSDIVHELVFRHTLRDHYFPYASVLDEVRKLVPRPAALTEQELEQAPGETIEDYIKRLREKDPRFIYEVSIGGDRGPGAFPLPPEPGCVAAVTDGRRTIKAFARDPEALSLDPPKFSATFTGSGVEKILSAIRTGRVQHFDSDEIREFKGNLPLQSLAKLKPGEFEIQLLPASVRNSVPLRLSFIGESEQVVYEFLEFETTRAGTHEVEMCTKNNDLPFRIQFVFPTPVARSNIVHMNIKKQFVGSDAVQARKAIAVFRVLKGGCDVDLFSLQHGRKLGALRLPPTEFGVPAEMSNWIDRLAQISAFFQVPIRLPDPGAVNECDFDALSFLYALASGEEMSLGRAEMQLVKSEQNLESFPNALRIPTSFAFVHRDVVVQLFGTEIHVGSCGFYLDRVEFNDQERTLADFLKAQIGQGVRLSIKPLAPARVFRVQDQGEFSDRS
jgi:hypothetical protein